MPNFDTSGSGGFDWSSPEERLFDDALSRMPPDVAEQITNDGWLGVLHHEALWDFELAPDQREGVYAAFEDYVQQEYGIDWDDYYDWESYREAYDAA
jgi:hypothetical protein